MIKKIALSLILSFAFLAMNAQTTIPNADFENWTGTKPTSWDAANFNIMGIIITTVIQDSLDPQSGNVAVKMQTTTENILGSPATIPGLVTLGTFVLDIVNQTGSVEGGIPFSGRPISLKGYVQANPAANDSAFIGIGISHWDGTKRDTIGKGELYISGQDTGWVAFDIPINYTSNVTPDSMNIIISSSDVAHFVAVAGSKLRVDNLQLDYGNVIIEEDFANTSFRLWADEYKNLYYDISSLNTYPKTLQVYSINGVLQYEQDMNGMSQSGKIGMYDVSAGIYILRLETANGNVYSKRFVMQR